MVEVTQSWLWFGFQKKFISISIFRYRQYIHFIRWCSSLQMWIENLKEQILSHDISINVLCTHKRLIIVKKLFNEQNNWISSSVECPGHPTFVMVWSWVTKKLVLKPIKNILKNTSLNYMETIKPVVQIFFNKIIHF